MRILLLARIAVARARNDEPRYVFYRDTLLAAEEACEAASRARLVGARL
jgi:hypothetical protein